MAVTRCEHAIVVVGDEILPDPRLDIPDAEPVVFGQNGEGVEGVANRAAKLLHLSQSGLSDVLRMARDGRGPWDAAVDALRRDPELRRIPRRRSIY